MNNTVILGVDIGGSHITASLINLSTRSVINGSKVRQIVNTRAGANEIVAKWVKVIIQAYTKHPLTEKKLGVAMPGPFDYNEGVSWMKNQDKFDALYGMNVKQMLAESLNIPTENIRFSNDAESFLSGEVFAGGAKGTSRSIGLTLGTGLGSARFIDGIVEDANLWCSPFLNATAEDFLSTRWFVKRYYELSGNTIAGVKELTYLTNDKYAIQTFNEFGTNLGLFLKEVILKDHPEAVVIGGNISNAFIHFQQALTEEVSGLHVVPVIKTSVLGEGACLIGAASRWLSLEAYETLRA